MRACPARPPAPASSTSTPHRATPRPSSAATTTTSRTATATRSPAPGCSSRRSRATGSRRGGTAPRPGCTTPRVRGRRQGHRRVRRAEGHHPGHRLRARLPRGGGVHRHAGPYQGQPRSTPSHPAGPELRAGRQDVQTDYYRATTFNCRCSRTASTCGAGAVLPDLVRAPDRLRAGRRRRRADRTDVADPAGGPQRPQPAATSATATAHSSRPAAWARWTCSRSTVAASITVNAG